MGTRAFASRRRRDNAHRAHAYASRQRCAQRQQIVALESSPRRSDGVHLFASWKAAARCARWLCRLARRVLRGLRRLAHLHQARSGCWTEESSPAYSNTSRPRRRFKAGGIVLQLASVSYRTLAKPSGCGVGLRQFLRPERQPRLREKCRIVLKPNCLRLAAKRAAAALGNRTQ